MQDMSAEPLLSSYDHNVQVHSDAALSVVAFNTEAGFDELLINFDFYSG